MESGNLLFAFTLTLLAGLSTAVGSLMAFASKKFSPKFLSGALGLSAGVMIYVSFIEIFPKARIAQLRLWRSTGMAHPACLLLGMGIIALIDFLVPSYETRTR